MTNSSRPVRLTLSLDVEFLDSDGPQYAPAEALAANRVEEVVEDVLKHYSHATGVRLLSVTTETHGTTEVASA